MTYFTCDQKLVFKEEAMWFCRESHVRVWRKSTPAMFALKVAKRWLENIVQLIKQSSLLNSCHQVMYSCSLPGSLNLNRYERFQIGFNI